MKSSRVLNDESIILGLNITDIIALGMTNAFVGLICQNLKLNSIIVIPILMVLTTSILVFLRSNYRRKIIRDNILWFFNKNGFYMQKLKKIENYKGLNVWLSDNGKVGTTILVNLIDVELFSEKAIKLKNYLDNLPYNLKVRFQYTSSIDDSISESTRDIDKIGYAQNGLLITFEKKVNISSIFKKNFNEKIFDDLIGNINIDSLRSVFSDIYFLSKEEVNSLIPESLYKMPVATKLGIDFGHNITAVIKLNKLSEKQVSELDLTYKKIELPKPYKIITSIQRTRKESSELKLRQKTKQNQEAGNKIDAQKWLDSEDALSEIILNGENLFQFEAYLVIERDDEAQLREDLTDAIQSLRSVGEFGLEGPGSIQTFKSLLIAGDFHYPLFEFSKNITKYIPYCEIGEFEGDLTESSIVLHRDNFSLINIDILSSNNACYNAVIVGASGSGKSVLANMLTESILNDPKNYIIKVDVGGSHANETKRFGGVEYNLTLDRPSRLNPFKVFNQFEHKKYFCSIISNLLQVLITENNEPELSKDIISKIEEQITLYSESRPENPSINDFYQFTQDFPRKNLLKRWCDGGIYENAFKGNLENNENRLQYFNFKQISEASNNEYTQGGFAAIMAEFNIQAYASTNKRIVFIADETPFFIKKCFNFFKLSTANVRKLGHSIVTIVQKSNDLIINNDTGIIENSPNHFLFSVDGNKKDYKYRFNLSDTEIDRILSFNNKGTNTRQCLVSSNFGKFVGSIYLSPYEYLKYSSSKQDINKIIKAIEFIPNLTEEEAIKCLSV
ncbi:MAG: hypothetical protein MK008_09785 [Bdellovibrionales bacterium]|nr:hypothetical protein [Bdellovibrionales bacterium]